MVWLFWAYIDNLFLQGRIWMLLLGYIMGFGAVFAKTWRLKVIFKVSTARSKVSKSYSISFTSKHRKSSNYIKPEYNVINDITIFTIIFLQIITDSQLYVIILVFVMLGASILTIQAAIDPIKLHYNISSQPKV